MPFGCHHLYVYIFAYFIKISFNDCEKGPDESFGTFPVLQLNQNPLNFLGDPSQSVPQISLKILIQNRFKQAEGGIKIFNPVDKFLDDLLANILLLNYLTTSIHIECSILISN